MESTYNDGQYFRQQIRSENMQIADVSGECLASRSSGKPAVPVALDILHIAESTQILRSQGKCRAPDPGVAGVL